MKQYEAVIGLEVHVHLNTESKAFCACSTEFGAQANTHTCPVCLGFPGSLPVLNAKALDFGLKAALALDCRIQPFTKFDRKNYYYPDLPKNYQISQYDLPLALSGFLDIETSSLKKRVAIKRVHLEEDAGKLIHEADCSLVDFNRAGIPLLEIVSEPDMNAPDEAYEYLVSLKAILKYLEISDCDMEKGQLRCDANISLREKGVKTLGTKSELKNLNSFKAVRDSLEFEINRQKEILNKNQPVIQETRLWDSIELKTYPMRSKEEAMDYRYFPEPDLVPFTISPEKLDSLRKSLPELPKALKERFIAEYGLSSYDAGVLTSDKPLAEYFQSCIKLYPNPKSICNWLIGAVKQELNARSLSIDSVNIKAGGLISLIKLVEEEKISNLAGKEVLKEMFDTDKDPEAIIKEKDLMQVSDTAQLEGIIAEVISENAQSVESYKSGKTGAIMFLVGQVMRRTNGKANPKAAREILEEKMR